MVLLMTAIFIYFLAIIFGGLEVEIESETAWADGCDTWMDVSSWYARLYVKILGGRPLTGYHCWMFLLPLTMFHLPFFMGTKWNISNEINTWSFYFVFCVQWDYLWFILNPIYGFKNYRRENIWWHAREKWIAGFPIGYYSLVGISVILKVVESWLGGSMVPVINHFILLFMFVFLTILVIFFSPIYHKWYWEKRKTDDREKAGINYPLKPAFSKKYKKR